MKYNYVAKTLPALQTIIYREKSAKHWRVFICRIQMIRNISSTAQLERLNLGEWHRHTSLSIVTLSAIVNGLVLITG